MLEDYRHPRREGGRGTEGTTIPGGQTRVQMDDVLYFQKKFLNTLNVPVSRLNSDALYSIGRATEITRDELKFGRFIVRLRSRFSNLFLEMLKKQLVLKGITTPEDWQEFAPDIKFDFAKDNYFTELKDAEIASGRVELARNFQDMAGKYYSHNWIRKNVLKQTDEDIKEQDVFIGKENQTQDPRWINPTIISNEQMAEQAAMAKQQMQMQQQGLGPDGQPLQPGTEGTGTAQGAEQAKLMQDVQNAEIIVKQMKALGKENRTMADEAKYKKAVQIIAKHKDLASRVPGSAGTQQ